MRVIHRWISTLAGLFLIVIAGSGIALQLEMMADGGGGSPAGAPGGQGALARTFSDEDLHRMLDTSLSALHRTRPGAAVTQMALLSQGKQLIAEISTIQTPGPPLRFDAATGASLDGSPVTDAKNRALHLFLLRLHRGDVIGITGNWLDILCGVCLFILGITGLKMFIHLWRRRLNMHKYAPFWK